MSRKRSWKALGLVALLVLFGALLQGMSLATSATTSDPSGDSTGGTGTPIDITSVSHADDGTSITYSAHTLAAFNNTSDFFQMQWDLDLNANGSFGEGSDACILVEQNGSGGLIAELKPACGTNNALTANVATATPGGGGEDVTFSFSNTQFRAATSFNGTTYNYKITSTDIRGNVDLVPNSGFLTHSGVSAAATPTPVPTPTPTPVPTAPPGSTQVSTTQSEQVTVDGVLSISALQNLVDFGHVSTGQSTSGVATGELDYTNTLNNGAAWNVTVQATSLKNGTNIIPFSKETYTPGTSFTASAGSSGGNPSAGSSSQGAFIGTDTTPGTTYSNPVTVATAAGTSQGAFQQSGGVLALNVPLSARPGAYTGTMQYTITG